MKRLLILACFLAVSFLEAEVSLSNLIEYDKETCLERITKADNSELWDVFLKVQADLFYDKEVRWIEQGIWWTQSQKILEIGSGNGAYLSKLAAQFQEKAFQGVEKLPQFVKQSKESYEDLRLGFQEGDAEIFNPQLEHSADVVLFRLTLQHLKDPTKALENAWHYLKPGGFILIIDSFDKARKSSHSLNANEAAMQQVAERQREQGRGNRKVTIQLLNDLEINKGPMSDLYEVVFSNLNPAGEVLSETFRFEGERDRKLLFNQLLLLLTLVNRTFEVPVDLDTAYDQLKDFLNDEAAWILPGMHHMVLKKKM